MLILIRLLFQVGYSLTSFTLLDRGWQWEIVAIIAAIVVWYFALTSFHIILVIIRIPVLFLRICQITCPAITLCFHRRANISLLLQQRVRRTITFIFLFFDAWIAIVRFLYYQVRQYSKNCKSGVSQGQKKLMDHLIVIIVSSRLSYDSIIKRTIPTITLITYLKQLSTKTEQFIIARKMRTIFTLSLF